MKKNKLYILGLLASAFLIISCDNKSVDPVATSNSFFIKFDNRIGLDEIALGSTKATNFFGEEYTVTALNYFVSNIKLTNENGEVLDFPDQYFLIREIDKASHSVELKDVPAGNYNKISYMIGVDSLTSTSDISSLKGVLDQASYGDDNMYWGWNSGYIFFKFEGNSNVIEKANPDDKTFKFHIGGYGGRDTPTANNLKTVDLAMTTSASVSEKIAPEVHVIFDASSIMGGKNKLFLGEVPVRMSPSSGSVVAENYASGFRVDRVYNETHD